MLFIERSPKLLISDDFGKTRIRLYLIINERYLQLISIVIDIFLGQKSITLLGAKELLILKQYFLFYNLDLIEILRL